VSSTIAAALSVPFPLEDKKPLPPAQALMEAVARGDGDAFRELVDRYQKRVYRLALSYLRRHDDALDIVQETFVRVYRARASVRPDADPIGWVMRIAANLCIDHQRRRRRLAEDPLPEPETAREPAALGTDPLGLAMEAERERALSRALDALAPRQRMVFVLRHYQQLSLGDIATTLGCSVGTVKSSLHRAIIRLREALAGAGHA
jgi:RNA polymerase sigma-70 factor (ECF subfamily)